MEFELKRWSLDQIDDVAEFANNPRIAANLRNAFPYPYTRRDAEDYVRACIENGEERQCVRSIVAEGRTVGSIGVFLGSDVYCKNGELGYWLAEPYWGRGIMSAAVGRLCDEVFARYDVERIYAEPFARNLGSRRVLEKAGFQLEGILRRSVFKNGELGDSCMYARIRE